MVTLRLFVVLLTFSVGLAQCGCAPKTVVGDVAAVGGQAEGQVDPATGGTQLQLPEGFQLLEPERPPDLKRGSRKQVAKLDLDGGKRVELWLSEENVYFRPGTREVAEYQAAVLLYLVFPRDGAARDSRTLIWFGGGTQFPPQEESPSEPHDFHLARGEGAAVGVAFTDNGQLHFAEVDTSLSKKTPRLIPDETRNADVRMGIHWPTEQFDAAHIVRRRPAGMLTDEDQPLHALEWKDGAWVVTISMVRRFFTLRRDSLGHWREIEPWREFDNQGNRLPLDR